MSNERRHRRGVVKQLSNLSIDEVSLVDRGANQHALISIAKRAPEATDFFEEVEKDWATYDAGRGRDRMGSDAKQGWKDSSFGHRLGYMNKPSMHGQRKADDHETFKEHPKTVGAIGGWTGHGAGATGATTAGFLGGLGAGSAAGAKLGSHFGAGAEAAGALGGAVAGAAGGGAGAAKVVHNHYYGKRLGDDSVMDVDALFDDVSKKKSSTVPTGSGSFGRGGNQAVLDTFTGSDPSGVVAEPNGEDGDVGPDGTISGTEKITGEDMPPKKKKSVSAGGDINPTNPAKGSVGKSADFWKNVVSKILDDDEFETDNSDSATMSKHFPGPPGGGGMQPPQQQPMMGQMPPQAGMMGGGQMGQPPMAQSVGAQPMGMGQPTAPPGAPASGMPAQLPPDVIQYIQQLEQALDQATGGQISGDDESGDSSSSTTSGNGSSGGTDSSGSKNPFGKSLETSGMDETTFLTELAKSLDDDDEREVVTKSMEIISKAEQRAARAESIAKAERDLRLEREFVAKAAEFNLPVKSSDLGPVLKRAAESLEEQDFKTIVKCLRSASAAADFGNPYGEVGKRGGGDNADILSQVEQSAMEFSKNQNVSPEEATLQVLNENPAAYDEYLRDKRQRSF